MGEEKQEVFLQGVEILWETRIPPSCARVVVAGVAGAMATHETLAAGLVVVVVSGLSEAVVEVEVAGAVL